MKILKKMIFSFVMVFVMVYLSSESLLLEFINKRLMPSIQRVDFFAPIKNPKIDTGLKKKKLTPKVVNLLKEDKQAFGLLGGKNTSLLEAHIYP